MALHETLGEVFRAFQHSTLLRRSYDRDVLCALIVKELVVDAFHQRVFRTYNHHVDAVVNNKVLQLVELVHAYRHVLAHIARSSIAWSNKKFLTLIALCDFPCQRVFTSA